MKVNISKNTRNVFNAWMNNKKFKAGPAIWTDGKNIYCHDVTIVTWPYGTTRFVINNIKVNHHITKHQKGLGYLMEEYGIKYFYSHL